MKTQKLQLNSDYHLSNLIDDIDKGDLRLPRFQRDYVWSRQKVISLLDSIYNEFPIGSFFVWHAHSRYRSLYKNIAELDLPDPVDERQLRYILDGQQRATSLYVAIKGLKINNIDYSKICFNLENEQFSVKTPNGTSHIALCDIVDSEKALAISRKVPDEYFTTFQRCSNQFQQYPLSLISVKDMDLGDAIEIFERINRGGVRLGTFDLVVASTWSEDFDLKVEYEKLRDDLRKSNYGVLGPEVVSQTIALILKKFCTRAHQLSVDSEDLKVSWKEIETSIRSAVSYLRSNLGAYSVDFMPYPSMIALVAYAFYNSEGRSLTAHTSDAIQEWFWKSALNERYSATLENKLGEDRRDIIDVALSGEPVTLGVATLNEDRIRTVSISNRSAIRNAFFCMLALKHPRHFKTGENFPISDILTIYGAVEKHHIFPRAFLRDNAIGNENNITNFCFIPAELNKEITNRRPSVYFADFASKNADLTDTLKSHLLEYDDVIKKDDYMGFIEKRSRAIVEQFERLVGSKLLRDLNGDANKALDNIELQIRRTIAHRCAEDWDMAISKKLQEKIDERIKREQKHTSTVNAHVTHLEQLRQLDIPDYMNIIENNWDKFSDKFETIEMMRARFNSFRRFRNDVKHSRTIDEVTSNEGKAALVWLARCLS